jgi:hypothetical protein
MIRKKAVIITFSTKTDKNSDRTKFFKDLYGWEQTVPGKKKKYEYHREGFLEKVPHKKIAESSFMIPECEFDKVMQFFEQWHKKVITNAFKILLEDQDIFDEFERMQQEFDREKIEEENEEQMNEDENLSEEEKNIIKRHEEWQKKKAKFV